MDVDVKWIYGDYEIQWEEQGYHDDRVDTFKWQLKDIIKSVRFNVTIAIVIECEYYPATRKFKILSITNKYRSYLARALDLNPNFVKEYIK